MDSLFQVGCYPRPAKPFALFLSPPKAGTDPFLNHRAFKFGEQAKHLKHGLAAGCGRVEPLLVQEKVDPKGVQLGEEANKVLQTAAKPIHAPRHYQVELSLGRVPAQPVESRALIATLGAGNAVVL
jgi:hypothetical protein